MFDNGSFLRRRKRFKRLNHHHHHHHSACYHHGPMSSMPGPPSFPPMPFSFIPTPSSSSSSSSSSSPAKRCFPILPPSLPMHALPPLLPPQPAPPPAPMMHHHHPRSKTSFTIDNLIGTNKASTPTNGNSVLTITNRETSFRVWSDTSIRRFFFFFICLLSVSMCQSILHWTTSQWVRERERKHVARFVLLFFLYIHVYAYNKTNTIMTNDTAKKPTGPSCRQRISGQMPSDKA